MVIVCGVRPALTSQMPPHAQLVSAAVMAALVWMATETMMTTGATLVPLPLSVERHT